MTDWEYKNFFILPDDETFEQFVNKQYFFDKMPITFSKVKVPGQRAKMPAAFIYCGMHEDETGPCAYAERYLLRFASMDLPCDLPEGVSANAKIIIVETRHHSEEEVHAAKVTEDGKKYQARKFAESVIDMPFSKARATLLGHGVQP